MKALKLKKLVPFAVVAALGLSQAGNVQADVLSSALLDITNFKFIDKADGKAMDNITDWTINAGNNFGTLSADLRSVDGISTQNQTSTILSSTGGQFDGDPQCEGDCPTRFNNDFSKATVPPSSTYAYSDNELTGASIGIDLTGNGIIDIPAGVHSGALAEVSILTEDSGTSTSTTGTNTTLSFIAQSDTTMSVTFDYLSEALAFVSDDAEAPSMATASVAMSVFLTDTMTGIVQEFSADGFDELQISVGRNDASTGTQALGGTGSLADDFDLIAGHGYLLAIGGQVQAQAGNSVPEPHILALLGIGMILMGAPARLRRKV